MMTAMTVANVFGNPILDNGQIATAMLAEDQRLTSSRIELWEGTNLELRTLYVDCNRWKWCQVVDEKWNVVSEKYQNQLAELDPEFLKLIEKSKAKDAKITILKEEWDQKNAKITILKDEWDQKNAKITILKEEWAKWEEEIAKWEKELIKMQVVAAGL